MDITDHPAATAADTTDMQAGTLDRITQAVTKGGTAAAYSGLLSIANTVLDLTGQDTIDTENAIRKFSGNDVGDYYVDNRNAVDMAGFVGVSLIPGSLGVKGLKFARAGETFGNFSRVLNLTDSRKTYWLNTAIKETAESGGAIKSIVASAARRKQLGWEVADQALLGAAAELTIAATMHNSPVFDGDSLTDFGWNVALGTALSGTLGGALGSLAAKGILKSESRAIQSQLRVVDTVFDPKSMGLSKGSEIAGYLDGMLTLPEGMDKLGFKYKYDGTWKETTLDIGAPVSAARARATQLAQEEIAIKFNELAQGDAVIGQAYSSFVRNGIDAARSAGKSPDEIVELLHGYLENVVSIGGVDLERMALDSRKFYINLKPAGEDSLGKLESLVSKVRTATTSKRAYALADDVVMEDLHIVRIQETGATNIKQVWSEHPAADAVQLLDGSLRFNPASKLVRRVEEAPFRVRMFMDIETGTLAPETVPVFGDIASRGAVINTADYISAAGFKQSIERGAYATKVDAPPLEGSARFAWASKRTLNELHDKTNGYVNFKDIPVLQRLVELEKTSPDTMRKFTFIEGMTHVAYHEIANLKNYVEESRLEVLQSRLNELGAAGKSVDTRIIAANLGTTRDWVEETIANGFNPLVANPTLRESGILPTAAAFKPQNIAIDWDFAATPKMLPGDAYKMNMGPSHLATQELAWKYQVRVRQSVADGAINSVFAEEAGLILSADEFASKGKKLSASATSEGAGATVLGASNASYGENAKLFVQEQGKNTALLTQRLRDATIESIAAAVNAVREDPRAAAELGILTTALRKSELRYVIDPTVKSRLVSIEALARAQRSNGAETVDAAIEALNATSRSPHSFTMTSAAVSDFIRSHSQINHTRVEKFATLRTAAGLTTAKLSDLPIVYVPPINTVKYPYHAFVRTKEKVGLASDISMITAKSEDQLRALAADIGDDFDVIYKDSTERYFKAKGEYDYSLAMNEATVNSAMVRRGKLADFFPETRSENILEDYLQFHARQEENLVRTGVQVKNRQFFSELEFLSTQYRSVSESVTRGIGSKFKAKIADPFGDHIKTALNISKQQEFPLLDSLNDFLDGIGKRAGEALEQGFADAQKGLVSWEEANNIAARYGLGTPYRNIDTYLEANARLPRNLLKEGLQKANMVLATTTLRLDFANSLVNILSTPIMLGTELTSIKQAIKSGDPLAGKLNELMSVAVPGKPYRVPSTTKLIANSINNFFGTAKGELISRYKDIGAIKEVSQLYHNMLDDLSFRPSAIPSEFAARIDRAVEIGAKISGNTFAEDFTRFLSADVMRQVTEPLVDASRMTMREQNAYISTFVNRVQGNYVTSQRPVAFQGTSGAAISLFQTYMFNVLQQLHRHMEAGDKRTLAVFAGLQASVFGLNGVPFFDAVNTHLIGGALANNPEHKDAYSLLPAFSKELGDWMLYGTASAFPLFSGSSPALFTRGDINPRHISIVPISPLDVPAVSASIKLVDTLYNTGKQVAEGADMSTALLLALEHQGWNRPLAGAAQLLAGRSTTSQGALISAANEMQTTSMLANLVDRTVDYGGVARVLGARPMDEALALNTLYRQKSYQAMDRARIERLGQVVKTKLYGGEMPTDAELDSFMLRYTRSGGRVETFNQSMQRWTRDANVSVVNQLASRLNSPYAQTLQTIMGGSRLPDYTTQE